MTQTTRGITPIQRRLVTPADEDDDEILFQHTILCQTSIPYRNPGDDVRSWTRLNGYAALQIQAGSAYDNGKKGFIEVGLPYGTKPRLVLYHLNAEAIKAQSPVIELEDSLTAFVRRTLGLDPGGRNIRVVKEQLTRLAAADFRFGMEREGRPITIKGTVIDKFELWTPKQDHQRMLWPTTVRFSPSYFASLLQHAVPLQETAVSRLSHSAMAMDIYTWLAQRLHRVDPHRPAFVPWASLQQQFGSGYGRMDHFKRFFRRMLRSVLAVYPDAKFACDDRGMQLHNSRPPVARRPIVVNPSTINDSSDDSTT